MQHATPPAPRPRLGAVSFLHRFGSGLNRHAHLHAAVTDGVFAPNHPLQPAVTALAVGSIGKQRDAATIGHTEAGHAEGDCCGPQATPRSHDTS